MDCVFIVRGSAQGHVWDGDPNHCAVNGGLGICNTGSGKPVRCALGASGCDVDHIRIAEHNLANPDWYAAARANLESLEGR